MARRHLSSVQWEPSEQERFAAQLLAGGATWQLTADQVGVASLQTIANWLKRPEFIALKRQYEEAISRALGSSLEDGVREMVELWRAMVRGEVPPNDGRLKWISPTVQKFFEGSFIWDDAPASNPSAIASLATQVNINLPNPS